MHLSRQTFFNPAIPCLAVLFVTLEFGFVFGDPEDNLGKVFAGTVLTVILKLLKDRTSASRIVAWHVVRGLMLLSLCATIAWTACVAIGRHELRNVSLVVFALLVGALAEMLSDRHQQSGSREKSLK